MPTRNLTLIVIASILSLVCYHRASRNRFAGTLTEAMNLVTTHYVDEVDDRVLFEGAINGMIDQLDPNSSYTSPKELPRFQESIDQEFPGIGIRVEIDRETKRLMVESPVPNTPAFRAGLQAGDLIWSIDGADTEGLTLEGATGKIRGPAGSAVKLQIRREDAEKLLDFSIVREKIPIESVLGDVRLKDGSWVFRLQAYPRIGFIRILTFGERTVDDLRAALQSFGPDAAEIDGLILDLRGDPGGLLDAAVKTCDAFLDEGQIVSTRGRGGVELESHRATSGVEFPREKPVVVLIDSFSASASEIVAACLQDHERAQVVGQRSWGKGTVQKIHFLEGGQSALRLTFATYWRPSGQDIHKRSGAKETDAWGVKPNPGLEVALSREQLRSLLELRRRRDDKIWEEFAPESPPTTIPKPATEPPVAPPDPAAIPAPAAEPEESAPNPDDPPDVSKLRYPQDDPQLQKAIEVLEQAVATPKTGRA